jgi:hypothetical protein
MKINLQKQGKILAGMCSPEAKLCNVVQAAANQFANDKRYIGERDAGIFYRQILPEL